MTMSLSQSEVTALTSLFVQLKRVIPMLASPMFAAESMRSVQSATEQLRLVADEFEGVVPPSGSGSNGASFGMPTGHS